MVTKPREQVLLLSDIVCETNTGLATVPLVEERSFASWQRDIPAQYWALSADALAQRIRAARVRLGDRAVILGHHYQREDIIQFADFRGDSLKLAQWAASRGDTEFIVFCGVHFMAEAADILSQPNQQVILPNMAAGCSMADMADPDDVYAAWDELAETIGTDDIIPVTYINSAASLKAFCGRNNGIVCTSSNAAKVLAWAFERGKRAFFFPDQHLGRNTAIAMGIPQAEMVLWDYHRPSGSLGGSTRERLEASRVILWQGHCSVHARFNVDQIRWAREEYPGISIVVHPECPLPVVQAADSAGSTEFIVRQVTDSPPGSAWGIGTEVNLVDRLAHENPDKTVFCLDPVVCPCSTMYRVHPAYLAWVLEELVEGRVVNRVSVDDETKGWARVALDRMLAVK